MDNYCNYHNPEWCKKFDGLRSGLYKTQIDGNTFYIVFEIPDCNPVYKKIFKNLYRKVEKGKANQESVMCVLVMCKLKESTLIDVLESYGFEIGEK